MRIIITFISLIFVTSTLDAQTTIRHTVGSQPYDITYNTGTYDSFESDIDTNYAAGNLPFWLSEGTATSFATSGHGVAGLRFPFSESVFSGSDTVLYRDANGQGQVLQSDSATYAIKAVAVPAPLPILGILPVVGFLKRMRKRQRA